MPRLDTYQIFKDQDRSELDYSKLSSLLRRAGYSAPHKKVHDLMKNGALIGVKKGLYAIAAPYTQNPICQESLANLIYGPSCISLEYALASYNLIPERVSEITSVTPKKDKRFETPLGIFTYRYLANEKYREDIDLVWVDSRHPVLMASPEKALCDYIVLRKISGLQTAKDAQRFLIEDLRLDLERFKGFDWVAFNRLNRVYRSKSLEAVLTALEGARG